VKTRESFAFIARVVCVALCLIALLMMAGCGRRTVTAEEGEMTLRARHLTLLGRRTVTAEEGEMTCAQCHLDRELLKADLEADPPPEPVKAENEGEG
jgi:hypothetical protein